MDQTYFQKIVENLELINSTQANNIKKAASLMADAIEADKLINVYGGGGHTTLCMGEMFFRAGGLANINPIAETGLTVSIRRSNIWSWSARSTTEVQS